MPAGFFLLPKTWFFSSLRLVGPGNSPAWVAGLTLPPTHPKNTRGFRGSRSLRFLVGVAWGGDVPPSATHRCLMATYHTSCFRTFPNPSSCCLPDSRPIVPLATWKLLEVSSADLLLEFLHLQSSQAFSLGRNFLLLLVPLAPTQRKGQPAHASGFLSVQSCSLQKPSGPALASGCFLPPEKGGALVAGGEFRFLV